jgi:LysR family transcriptional activator of dmlA
MMLNSISDLRLFLAILEHGSISAAAAQSRLTAAAASKRLMALEDGIGKRLFHRSTRALRPTSDALEFVPLVRALVARADDADRFLGGSGEVSGHLRLTASATFADRFLGPVLDTFLRLHPKVTIDVDLTDRVLDLISEGVDVAIRYGNLEDSRLVARRLLKGRQILCASPQYLDQFGRPEKPDDLLTHRCLVLGSNDRWRIEHHGQWETAHVSPAFTSSMGAMVRQMAIRGHGVALLADWLVSQDLSEGALEQVLPSLLTAEVGIYAVYPSRDHMPTRLRILIDHLVSSLGDGTEAPPKVAEDA